MPASRSAILLLTIAALYPSPAHQQNSGALRRLDAARELKQNGSLRAAEQAYEALLPAFRGEPNANLLGTVLFETSQTAMALGDYQLAIDRATEASAAFHARKDAANEALAVNAVGVANTHRGDYEAALRSFEKALLLDRQQHDAKGEISRLSNIANVYFFQGKYLDALQSYEQALRRVNQTAGESWNPARRQLVLSNLATLYEQLGQNERALDYYKQAQASGAAMRPSEYAQLLANQGTLYRRLGDPVKALESYRAAQQWFSKEQLSAGQIHVLQNIGIALALDLHNLEGALAPFTEALKLAEATSNRRETVLARLFRGEALFRLDKLDAAASDFLEALSAAREIGAMEEQWTAQYGLGRIERSHGRDGPALQNFRQAIAGIESVRSGLGASSLKAEFLANKRDVYDACIEILLRTDQGDAAQLFGLIEQARSRNLQDALRDKTPLPSFRSLQGRLDAESMLVEYWISSSRVAALWVTRKKSGVVTRPLADSDVKRLAQVAATLRDTPDTTWRGNAVQTGSLLLSGIPLAAPTTNLLIVPDGILNSLPFEVLSTSGSTPLVEQFAISYLPSAALLSQNTAQQSMAPPWKRQLIVFGDPVPPPKGALPGDERWSRLPDAPREIRAIADAVPGRAEVHAGTDDLKAFLAAGRAAGVPLLHLATHAAVDTLDPNRSRILFTQDGGRRGSEYLFWREVPPLPLSGVSLVTLSACDTEAGKMVRGEGVQSFSRAFLAAGAKSTVTTLWRVADRPTADFMQRFYRHLARGESKAEALRATKLDFLHSGTALAQPMYWAAFVLNGDGRIPVAPVLSWAWIVTPALIPLVVVSYLYRRRRASS